MFEKKKKKEKTDVEIGGLVSIVYSFFIESSFLGRKIRIMFNSTTKIFFSNLIYN